MVRAIKWNTMEWNLQPELKKYLGYLDWEFSLHVLGRLAVCGHISHPMHYVSFANQSWFLLITAADVRVLWPVSSKRWTVSPILPPMSKRKVLSSRTTPVLHLHCSTRSYKSGPLRLAKKWDSSKIAKGFCLFPREIFCVESNFWSQSYLGAPQYECN